MKKSLIVIGTIGILLVCQWAISIVPVIASPIEGFSQKVGDSCTWEITIFKPHPLNFETVNGSRWKMVVNETVQGTWPVLNDTWVYNVLRLNLSKNTPANRTWNFIGVISSTKYCQNLSDGIYDEYTEPWVVPPREITANVTALYTFLSPETFNLKNSTWTSGPNGYDGIGEGWNGSAVGDLNQNKLAIKFATDGWLEYFRIYNGTGSGWELILSMDCIDCVNEQQIPGFGIQFAVLPILLFGIIMIFRESRKKKFT